MVGGIILNGVPLVFGTEFDRWYYLCLRSELIVTFEIVG